MRRSVLTALLLVLAGCGYGEVGPYRPPPQPESQVSDGATLYARECGWCHGSRGEGTDNGPDLDGELDGGAYTYFMVSTGRMPLASPHVDAERSEPLLSDDQIEALVAHVEDFGGTGPQVPDPDPSLGSRPRGAELYLTNCAACHSSTGAGGALTSGRIAPRLDNPEVTPVQVAAAMAVGPGCSNNDPVCGKGSGAMPRFDFTTSEVNDITAYVQYLQQADNAGGWPIGKIGPVAEGAVAWLLGIIALVAVGRWIGTRVGEE